MNALRFHRLLLLLLPLGVLAQGSHAARAGEPDAESVEKAKRLLREAKDDYSAGRFELSRVKLDEACALAHTPNCVHNLAMAELKAGHPLPAYKHFREAFSVPSATWMQNGAAVVDAHKMMGEAYAAIGHVAIRAPAGASVTVDGQTVDSGGAPVDVAPGSHIVEAHLGAQIGRVQVEARAGAVDTVTLGLEAQSSAGGAPSSAPGTYAGAGTREVGPASAGGATRAEETGTAAGATSAAALETHGAPPPPPSAGAPLAEDRTGPAVAARPWWTTRRWLGLAAVGVGAASFVLDGVFYADAKSAPDAPTHNTYAALTIASVGVGALGVAGGALLVLWPDAPSRTSVVPLVSPAFGGLLLRRGF